MAVAKPLEKFPAIYAVFGSLSVYYGQPFLSEVYSLQAYNPLSLDHF